MLTRGQEARRETLRNTVMSTPGSEIITAAKARSTFLLDTFLQGCQISFGRLHSLQLKLQQESVMWFQPAFQGRLQLRNLVAQAASSVFAED